MKQKCEVQDVEIHKFSKNAQAAASLAAEESSKCKVATEVVKSISVQVLLKQFLFYIDFLLLRTKGLKESFT